MLGLTSPEVYKSIFKINTTNNKIELYTDNAFIILCQVLHLLGMKNLLMQILQASILVIHFEFKYNKLNTFKDRCYRRKHSECF